MDMRQYAGSCFLKFEDVRDAPRVEKIQDVIPGKYDKPDLKFESGDCLSLNATNCKTLVRAFGDDSRDWIALNRTVCGKTDFQGEKKDSVLVKPLSPQKNPASEAKQPKRDEMDEGSVLSTDSGGHEPPLIYLGMPQAWGDTALVSNRLRGFEPLHFHHKLAAGYHSSLASR